MIRESGEGWRGYVWVMMMRGDEWVFGWGFFLERLEDDDDDE